MSKKDFKKLSGHLMHSKIPVTCFAYSEVTFIPYDQMPMHLLYCHFCKSTSKSPSGYIKCTVCQEYVFVDFSTGKKSFEVCEHGGFAHLDCCKEEGIKCTCLPVSYKKSAEFV